MGISKAWRSDFFSLTRTILAVERTSCVERAYPSLACFFTEVGYFDLELDALATEDEVLALEAGGGPVYKLGGIQCHFINMS